MIDNAITFSSGKEIEVIRLDANGFHYRGQVIEDAGEAHQLFVEFMRQAQRKHPEPTNE